MLLILTFCSVFKELKNLFGGPACRQAGRSGFLSHLAYPSKLNIFLVDRSGFEPLTSSLQTKRSTN